MSKYKPEANNQADVYLCAIANELSELNQNLKSILKTFQEKS